MKKTLPITLIFTFIFSFTILNFNRAYAEEEAELVRSALVSPKNEAILNAVRVKAGVKVENGRILTGDEDGEPKEIASSDFFNALWVRQLQNLYPDVYQKFMNGDILTYDSKENPLGYKSGTMIPSDYSALANALQVTFEMVKGATYNLVVRIPYTSVSSIGEAGFGTVADVKYVVDDKLSLNIEEVPVIEGTYHKYIFHFHTPRAYYKIPFVHQEPLKGDVIATENKSHPGFYGVFFYQNWIQVIPGYEGQFNRDAYSFMYTHATPEEPGYNHDQFGFRGHPIDSKWPASEYVYNPAKDVNFITEPTYLDLDRTWEEEGVTYWYDEERALADIKNEYVNPENYEDSIYDKTVELETSLTEAEIGLLAELVSGTPRVDYDVDENGNVPIVGIPDVDIIGSDPDSLNDKSQNYDGSDSDVPDAPTFSKFNPWEPWTWVMPFVNVLKAVAGFFSEAFTFFFKVLWVIEPQPIENSDYGKVFDWFKNDLKFSAYGRTYNPYDLASLFLTFAIVFGTYKVVRRVMLSY